MTAINQSTNQFTIFFFYFAKMAKYFNVNIFFFILTWRWSSWLVIYMENPDKFFSCLFLLIQEKKTAKAICYTYTWRDDDRIEMIFNTTRDNVFIEGYSEWRGCIFSRRERIKSHQSYKFNATLEKKRLSYLIIQMKNQ